ncbi:MAG TPA: class I SAM-dependent methyltransferase [Bryobacteraceae bacterium]|nr:class I SAM-dependent methyltransferase [Bryobacteraceae bacterium]
MPVTGCRSLYLRRGVPLLRVPFVLLLACASLAAQWEDGNRGDVPYVPTPPEVVEAMLKLGSVKQGDILYDLGCGDGRIVITAAKKYGAKGTGIDINPERIKEAEENAKQEGVTGRVRFLEKNLFEADFHDATVVTLYLLPDVNLRLRPRLLSQLKPGARIVSHSFDMGEWKPDKTVEIDHRRLHLWVVTEKAKMEMGEKPAKAGHAASVDGDWNFRMPSPSGEVEAALTLKTEGNRLAGTFVFGENRKLHIQDGTVEDNKLRFTVRRDRAEGGVMVYKMTGTVDGAQIRGETETEMDGQPITQEWSAKRK